MLSKENQGLLEQNMELKNNTNLLQLQVEKLSEGKNTLSEELARQMDVSLLKRTEKERDALAKENAGLLKELKSSKAKEYEMSAEISQTARQLDKIGSENKDLTAKFEALNKLYSVALQKNKQLEQGLVNEPKKFAELARQNEVLIKRTANTHYNAGVFYMQQKEYSRAASEFEKAIELNPEDAYAHFNLGYIYAEHLVNREKAIEQFRDYLRLAKKDDKDVDWVKSYLLTWESWEGKKTVP
jgi:tetratricopeptide (TPR) repeat protein